MEAITNNELININGGMNRRGTGSGGNDTRLGRAIRIRRSSSRKTRNRRIRAAGRGFGWAQGAVFVGKLVAAAFMN